MCMWCWLLMVRFVILISFCGLLCDFVMYVGVSWLMLCGCWVWMLCMLLCWCYLMGLLLYMRWIWLWCWLCNLWLVICWWCCGFMMYIWIMM